MEQQNMTAVDWLVNELKSYTFHERIDMAEWEELKKLSRKAKQIEKEQIVNAFVNGISEGYDDYICTEKGISRDRKTGKEYFAGMYKNDV